MVFDQRKEDALGILHECLHPVSAKKVLDNPAFAELLEEKIKETTAREIITKLVSIEDLFSPEYIATLTELRIGLLGA